MTNVYKIGVSLAMTSNANQVLGSIGQHLMGVHTKAKDLEGGLNRVKLALGGVIAIGAGVAILGMFKGPIEEAMKFETALARFSRFGLSDKLNRDAEAFAKNMNIAGSTYIENMNRITEAQGVFRESGLAGDRALYGAKLSAPILGKIDFVNRALDGESAAKMHTSGLDMLRFIEMKNGLNDPARFNQLADSGYRAVTSSGGNVNWSLYRQFMATGGVAAKGLSDTSLFGEMEPIIGELKSRAGTALMTSFNRLTGITHVPNQVAHDLVKAGIWDGSKIEWNSQGGIKRTLGNPLKDQELFSQSQFQWYQKHVVPMYDAQHLSDAERSRMDAMIGSRTGGMMFSLFRQQADPIRRSVDAFGKQDSLEKAYSKAQATTQGKFDDASAKFKNLMIEVGAAVLPIVNKALGAILPVLKSFGDWMQKHTAIVKGIAIGVAIFGAALIAAGAVAVAIAAGPIALWTVAIGALGALIVGFLVAFWGPLTKFFGDLFKWIGGFLHLGGAPGGPGGGASPALPPKAQPGPIHTTLNIDGRKFADAITPYHAKGLSAPTGPAGIDSTHGAFGPGVMPAF